MTQQLTALLVAVALLGIHDARPAAPSEPGVPQARQASVPSQQTGDADRTFAEITRARYSERIKLIPQLEQFIRDYPDYPRVETVYSILLEALARAKTQPERLQALADEALAKFTGEQSVRWSAYSAKFSALTPGSPAFKAMGRHILDAETSILVLRNAADIDTADALPLVEKAIAERKKRPDAPAGPSPSLDELLWAHAGFLADAGRTEEALTASIKMVDDTARRLADLEQSPDSGFNRSRVDLLRELLADRCGELVPRCVAAGRNDVALRYLGMQQRAAVTLLDRRPDFLATAAEMYEKLGRPDLALNGFVRAMAARMDPSTRDQIAQLARKTGKNPDEFYERARKIRAHDAKRAYPFALLTADGPPMKLADLKARAVLVSFFYPT